MHRQNSNERFQGMVEQYRAASMPWPASMQQVAEWAVRCNLYAPRPNAVIRELAERLSEALKVEYFVDPQGRSVRAKHAARVKQDDGSQPTLWDDIRTAPRDHMEIAFQQRRKGIVSDSYQLKQDVDSFNENGNPGPPIQLILDFTMDVAEREIMEGRNPDAA